MSEEKTVWQTLNDIDIARYIKQKGQLSYLPWSSAIGLVKPYYPDMSWRVIKNELGFNYHTDGHTCWVEVGVTIKNQEEIEYLPVMNHTNKSIPKDVITSTDVNKAIKRAVVKALAGHGLGISLYTGEELPSVTEEETKRKSYHTWSKANANDKLEYKKEFIGRCGDYGVEMDMITDLFSFLGVDLKDDKEKHNSIVQFLRSQEEYFSEQMEAYVNWRRKQNEAES